VCPPPLPPLCGGRTPQPMSVTVPATVLVTGASGLLGRAVKAAFESAGFHVVGVVFSRTGPGLVACDLRSQAAVEALLADVKVRRIAQLGPHPRPPGLPPPFHTPHSRLPRR
jgi:nucleoside-diphosphate-sugar epimerase